VQLEAACIEAAERERERILYLHIIHISENIWRIPQMAKMTENTLKIPKLYRKITPKPKK
jgi:hypothetical protein